MRVLIVDDHSIIRVALGHVLRARLPALLAQEGSAGVEVQEAETIAGALEACHSQPFDLVISDLYMPGSQPGDLEGLADACAPAVMVVFSMSENPDEVAALLRCGVRAFIPKSTPDNQLATILALVVAGGSYVPSWMALNLYDHAQTTPPPDHTPGHTPGHTGERPGGGSAAASALPSLTRRQQQVLELLGKGYSNAEIGEALGLNLSTVKSHVTAILKTLGVSSRTQAVLMLQGQSLPGRG